mgnify:CR=1 FL=1
MKRNLFLLTIGFFTFCNIYSINEEVVLDAASSFVVQNDSIQEKFNRAKNYFEKEDYPNALKEIQKFLDSKGITKKQKVESNYLLANIFYATRSNKNAIKYYRKTLSLIENKDKIDNNEDGSDLISEYKFIKAESLLKYGNTYYRLNNIDELKIHKDSALFFYKQVDKILSLDNTILEVKSRAYTNSSVIYLNDSLYDKAREFAKKAIVIHKNQKKEC